MNDCNLSKNIDRLIEAEIPFALWRIPGETVIHSVIQREGLPASYDDIETLNGRSGFVIAPFNISPWHPIILIQPDQTDTFPIPEEIPEPRPVTHPAVTPAGAEYGSQEQEIYRQKFDRFTEALKSGQVEKLVLSRCRQTASSRDVSLGTAFCRAVQRYIYSYIYLCYTPQTGIWMGCTPEILLAGSQGNWQTVALAGTQRLQAGKLPTSWDEKNRREQGLVARYIKQQLCSLGIETSENGPYTARAGELSHLKTEFHFTLPDEKQLGKVLKALHPTPAVCGLPKEQAYRFILENEEYDRSYYSGFIGWLQPGTRTDLYVNLRCMNRENGTDTFYAGGGLLPSSALASEWRETEDKMMTMGRLFF